MYIRGFAGLVDFLRGVHHHSGSWSLSSSSGYIIPSAPPSANTAAMTNDFEEAESLLEVESTFYKQGFAEGFDHGVKHGLFDGRSLGRAKGWEVWEEVGYYEGVALFWKSLLEVSSSPPPSSRVKANLDQLLSLIDAFPTQNNSTRSATDGDERAGDGVDMLALVTSIRAKYRTVCATLGIRLPRLQSSAGESSSSPVMSM